MEISKTRGHSFKVQGQSLKKVCGAIYFTVMEAWNMMLKVVVEADMIVALKKPHR